MSKIIRLVSFTLFLGLVLNACNLPSDATEEPASTSANTVLTAAAQTVEANLTQAAILNPPTVPPTQTLAAPTSTIAIATTSVPPTNTPPPPPTQSCDVSQFVDDVTIPDGTVLQPNQSFTKTWRLKNVGTCSWTPSYAVVFNSGDSMSGPATQALTGNVNPGQTIDISVELKAPASEGKYKSYWKLRNGAGVLFTQFYVDIEVKIPAPSTSTLTLNATGGSEGGTVYEAASGESPVNGTILAGDTASDFLARGFISFNISSISGKTVTAATLDLSDCSEMHDPFGDLAGIWVGEVQYTLPLDQTDYDITGSGITLLTSHPGSSIDVKSYVQTRVTAGESRFQIRLHPSAGSSNADGEADYMSCSATGPKLTITYEP